MIILGDGNMVPRNDPRAIRFLAQRNRGTNKWMIAAAVLAVFFGPKALTMLRKGAWDDDLREGHVPASDREPSEHWNILRTADFTRQYTRNADKDRFAWMRAPTVEDTAEGRSIDASMGGRNGHEAEDIDPSEVRGVSATRCTATNYAVTAYYCGDKIASNRDRDAAGPEKLTFGVDDFELILRGMRDTAEKTKPRGSSSSSDSSSDDTDDSGTVVYPRSVFRFGFGQAQPVSEGKRLSGVVDHVWTVIGQTDGTYFWIQSYINEYSLPEWMRRSPSSEHRKTDRSDAAMADGAKNAAVVGWEEMQRRVGLLRVVEAQREKWDEEVDDAYHELFNVRPTDKAMKQASGRQAMWTGGSLHVNLACEWPLKGDDSGEGRGEGRGEGSGDAAMDFLMRSMGVDPQVVAAREAAAAAREEEKMRKLGGKKGKRKNVQDEEDDEGEEDDEEEEDELL